MAERSGFFNARLQDGAYDRTYQAEDFADCLSLFIPNGIYVEDSETLSGTVDKTTVQGLKPYHNGGTKLSIKEGKAFINGYWYVLDEQDLEISLTVNMEKAIILMYTFSERGIKVVLNDLVDGQPSVPKTNVQYGILLGTVSYTSSGVLVTDLREEFMLGSPQTNHMLALRTQQNLKAYDEEIEHQNAKITLLNDRFILVEGYWNGVKFGQTVPKIEAFRSIAIGLESGFGSSEDWVVIFAGQDQETYYEGDSLNINEHYTGQYNLMVSSALAGMDNDCVISTVSPKVTSIEVTDNGGNMVIQFDIEGVGVILDLEEYANIKYRLVLMNVKNVKKQKR
jgi:hypothetical protein